MISPPTRPLRLLAALHLALLVGCWNEYPPGYDLVIKNESDVLVSEVQLNLGRQKIVRHRGYGPGGGLTHIDFWDEIPESVEVTWKVQGEERRESFDLSSWAGEGIKGGSLRFVFRPDGEVAVSWSG